MENLWSFYQSMPTVTRFYISACVLCTLGVQLDLISPFQLYFNYKLIFVQHEYWRLITTFLFFGTFSFTFMFNIMFTYRYSRMLEEGSFRSNSADFFFMLLFGAILMTLIAPFVKLLFLGHAFTIMLVYVWAKRNVAIHLSLFGLLTFRAPHLPWILLGFSLILGNSVLTDVMGICVGHIYYYLQDVFPYLPGGFRCLKTPGFIVYLFNPAEYYMEQQSNAQQANLTAEPTNNLTGESSNRTQQSDTNETAANQVAASNGESENCSTNTSQVNRENLVQPNKTNLLPESNQKTQIASNQSQTTSTETSDQTLRNRMEPKKENVSNNDNQATDEKLNQSNKGYQHEHLD